MNIDEWIQYGIDRGYCSNIHCDTCNGAPLTEEEAEAEADGSPPCCFVLRLFGERFSESQ